MTEGRKRDNGVLKWDKSGVRSQEPGVRILLVYYFWVLAPTRGITFADVAAVIDVALSLLAFIAGGVTLELFAAARAPGAHQDERTFYFGAEPSVGVGEQ